jgi:putative sigma-54 modulation protein
VKLIVKGRNIVVTDTLSDYAEEKIGRLSRYLYDGVQCDVELWMEKNPSQADNQVAEVTVYTKGPVIRAREASPDMYASIDLVAAKIERQVKKYRSKLVARHHPVHRDIIISEGLQPSDDGEEAPAEADISPRIVKTKQFMVKPMTPEEAALQLDLVGHDFFVFTNADSQDTAVVYRRRDGDFGLIEPQR